MGGKKRQQFFTLWDLFILFIYTVLHRIKFYIMLILYKSHLKRIIKRSDWGRR